MSLVATENNIYPIIEDLWDDSIVPVFYPNVKRTRFDDSYFLLRITEWEATQPCVGSEQGSTHERSSGDIVASLFVPANKTLIGTKRATEVCEDFKNMLAQKRFGSTIIFAGRVVDGGLSDDHKWYRYNIILRYQTNVVK